MSLENLRLPAVLIRDLYKNCLVLTEQADSNSSSEIPARIHFLGGNSSRIAIIVDDPRAAYLSDDSLTFLSGILAACGLTIGDVAIINLNKTPAINYQLITSELKAEIIIMLGITPEQIELPLYFPAFQVQQYNGQRYLHAPDLKSLKDNRDDKKQLWESLKKLFAIK